MGCLKMKEVRLLRRSIIEMIGHYSSTSATPKVIIFLYLDPGNTTSTSLKKYASHEEHNNTVRTSSFIEKKKNDEEKNFDDDSSSMKRYDSIETPKKQILKSFKKKAFDYKTTQYSASSNVPALPPFSDPEK